ncbi:MAG: ribonuclease P protein component [Anaerolineales bacterium]
MQRRFRLTRSEDFQKVRRTGKSYAHPLLVLVVRANDGREVRVGVAAGRAVGPAVKRNRAKRLMRAAMQVFVESLPAGWDLVLIARPPLLSSTFLEVRGALQSLLNRAQLLMPS